MKLLLTSFTMGWSIFKWYSVPERIDGIPPLAFREYSTEFFPDLSALLFCKKLIMDESTYFLFTTPECALYSKEYCRVFKALKNEGLLELKNYSDDLTKNRDLLLKMLQRDLKHLDVWVPALRKSCEIWKRVLQRATQDDELINLIQHYKGFSEPVRGKALLEAEQRDLNCVEEALRAPSRLRRAKYRDALRTELERYLGMVNGGLVLANDYKCGIYDWADHGPFYQEKFLSIGVDPPQGLKEIDAVKKLFEVAFPQLAVGSTKALLKILRDRRIDELRELVRSAAHGETEFDLEFANRTLQDVIKAEQRTGKLRKYISYATLPLGFLPLIGTPIQKAIEEAIAVPMDWHIKRDLSWYYMLTEALG